jgi:hypothetical protein
MPESVVIAEKPVVSHPSLGEGMAEKNTHSNRHNLPRPKQILLSLFVIAATLLVCETLARIVVALGNPPDFGSINFDRKYALAHVYSKQKKTVPSLIFLGTSYTEAAIYADYMQQLLKSDNILDVDVLNLAVRSSWTRDQLFLLKNAMNAKSVPLIVFYDVSPIGFGLNGDYAERFSEQLAKSHKNYLLEPKDDGLNSFKSKVKDFSYLVRYRPYFKQLLVELPKQAFNLEGFRAYIRKYSPSTESSGRGWTPLPSMATESELAETESIRTGNFKAWSMPDKLDPEQISYKGLNTLSAFCRKNHIPLVLLWLPVHKRAESVWKNALGLSAQDCQKGFAKLVDNRNVFLMDFHNSLAQRDETSRAQTNLYNPDFADCDHVNAIGAIKTTDMIESKLCQPPFNAILKNAKKKIVEQ